MKIKSQRGFFSGLMFLAFGIAFAWGSTTYSIGEGARMGPGYFPLVLGILLALLGAVILFGSLVVETEDGEQVGPWAWRPLFFIVAANAVFGLLVAGWPALHIPPFGLAAAVAALVLVGSLAGDDVRWKEAVLIAAVLAAGSCIVAVGVFNLPFAVWPTF